MTENSENTICKFLTSELPERYGVVRSVVYQRLKALSIKPIQVGNKSHITPDELQLMDGLNAHLKAGGKTEEFISECIEAGSIKMPVAPLAANESAIVQLSNETEIALGEYDDEYSGAVFVEIEASASAAEVMVELQSQKGKTVKAEDIAEVDQQSQQRAFLKAAAAETLTLTYEATENFTIPGMKERLEQHRAACRQARAKRMVDVNDFLSEALAPLKIGKSGLLSSPNSNKNQPPS